MEGTTETRVRMGFKQAAKGTVQLDLTVEAPTVEKAGELLEGAITTAVEKIHAAGLKTVGDE